MTFVQLGEAYYQIDAILKMQPVELGTILTLANGQEELVTLPISSVLEKIQGRELEKKEQPPEPQPSPKTLPDNQELLQLIMANQREAADLGQSLSPETNQLGGMDTSLLDLFADDMEKFQ